MTRNTIKMLVLTAACAAYISAVFRLKLQEREESQREFTLDVRALIAAQASIMEKIQRGVVTHPDQLKDLIDSEIAFQKIAVREI